MYVCALRFCLLIFAFNSILTVDNLWEKSFRLEIIFSQNSFLFKRSLILYVCVLTCTPEARRGCVISGSYSFELLQAQELGTNQDLKSGLLQY